MNEKGSGPGKPSMWTGFNKLNKKGEWKRASWRGRKEAGEPQTNKSK